MAGKTHPADAALAYSEEHFTQPDYEKAKKFLEWLYKNGLTIGHGTIDLRYHEFTKKLTPVSRDEAYQYALKQAGGVAWQPDTSHYPRRQFA